MLETDCMFFLLIRVVYRVAGRPFPARLVRLMSNSYCRTMTMGTSASVSSIRSPHANLAPVT